MVEMARMGISPSCIMWLEGIPNIRREKTEPRATFVCVPVTEARRCAVMNQPFSKAPQEISTCVHDDRTIKMMSRKDVAAKYKLSQDKVSKLVSKVKKSANITGTMGRRPAVANVAY